MTEKGEKFHKILLIRASLYGRDSNRGSMPLAQGISGCKPGARWLHHDCHPRASAAIQGGLSQMLLWRVVILEGRSIYPDVRVIRA